MSQILLEYIHVYCVKCMFFKGLGEHIILQTF